MVETWHLLWPSLILLWFSLTRFYALQMYTVVHQTGSCRRVKQNRDQEGKKNKATKGNTFSRVKVLPERRKNTKEFPLCLDHICLELQPQEATFETLNGIYNFLCDKQQDLWSILMLCYFLVISLIFYLFRNS